MHPTGRVSVTVMVIGGGGRETRVGNSTRWKGEPVRRKKNFTIVVEKESGTSVDKKEQHLTIPNIS